MWWMPRYNVKNECHRAFSGDKNEYKYNSGLLLSPVLLRERHQQRYLAPCDGQEDPPGRPRAHQAHKDDCRHFQELGPEQPIHYAAGILQNERALSVYENEENLFCLS